jgi:hypothetical protein
METEARLRAEQAAREALEEARRAAAERARHEAERQANRAREIWRTPPPEPQTNETPPAAPAGKLEPFAIEEFFKSLESSE